MMMTMTIKNLVYEEMVMLQNILWYTENCTEFMNDLDADNTEIFRQLYDKVMKS